MTDGNGCTAVGSDSVGTFIGIVDIYESGSVNIYPNPTSSKFLIEGIVIRQINIYDQQGKGLLTEQYSEKSNSVTISLDNFSKGI
mgnify:CR=1 FL=1